MERLTHSLAMERRAKRDAARRQYYEHKRAAKAKSALKSAEAPADAPVNAPVNALVSAPAEGSQSLEPRKEKDTFHLRTSSGNKVAKSGWTPINHQK
jgi:hypothetical protein